jgi:hypothetical protein
MICRLLFARGYWAVWHIELGKCDLAGLVLTDHALGVALDLLF